MSHYHSKDGQRWDIDGHYGMIVGQGTQMVNWHKGLMLGEHMSIGRSLFFLLFFGGGYNNITISRMGPFHVTCHSFFNIK